MCGGGTCGGEAKCDDNNVCTTDSCNSGTGACSHTNNTAPCDDGDLCTENDVCSGGTCGGEAKCDDGNVCTTDSCNSGTGACTNTNNTLPCDDGNFCTINDQCNGAGACTDTDPNPCDDGEQCTNDSCAANACVHTPRSGACNDGNACTTGDQCNSTLGTCSISTAVNCNDNNSCTTDSCNTTTGCVNTYLGDGVSCNDGNFCTQNDQCQGGTCSVSSPVVCNDNRQCTDDTCNPASGCVFTNRPSTGPNSACDDGLACTENDRCSGTGDCNPGVPNNSLCPQTDCSVGVCVPGNACVPDPTLKQNQTCRPSAGPCDIAEVCNGVSTTCPADDFSGSSVVCRAAECVPTGLLPEVRCDDTQASCVLPPDDTCNNFACVTNPNPACLTTCSGPSDCQSTHYCNNGTCDPRTNPGGACTQDIQCSGADRCVDGVCCNSTCSGQCEACDVPGSLGTCVPVTGDPHPGGAPGVVRPACTSDGTLCAGTCNGTSISVCTYPPSGSVCAAAACNPGTNTAVENSLCNGAGTCITPAPSDCSPFVCNGDVCHGNCSLDSHCEENLQCNGGTCVPLFADGDACTQNAQCNSGNCVDGVCCASTCPGQCEACNVPGFEGACTPVTGAPVMGRPACSGQGDCRGACNGSNGAACAFPQNEVVCREASCTDATATLTAYCNGAGQCPASQNVSCSEECLGDLCADGECDENSDCATGEVCRATVCVPADEDGTSCQFDSDCSSGLCVDGVCCNQACGGQCEACDVAGLEGICSVVAAGDAPHGARQACASDGSACGGTCDGTRRTGCGYPDGVECRPGSCTSGTATLAAQCNGSGSCPDLQSQDCQTFDCNPSENVCDGPCATDPSACATGEYCSAGICVPLADDGAACGNDDQCESGNCVDGFCCSTACDAQCAACDVPGSEGTCRATTGTVRGGRDACAGVGACGASCNGTDQNACAFPGAALSCGGPTCAAGQVTDTPTCSGDGRCTPGVVSSCPSLACGSASECATGCDSDEDCLGELICQDRVCVQDPLIDAVDKGSCGCRLPGARTPQNPSAPLILLAPLLLLVWRRRESLHKVVR